ncbi:MAG: hypothetical protein KKH28_00750 [Elusimicrobia bacterium]|nr:hypothetical protein [Elusimicrobiota bacterium]
MHLSDTRKFYGLITAPWNTVPAAIILGCLFLSANAPESWARSAGELDREIRKAERFDINHEGNRFELLGDFEGTTIIFKVYDPAEIKRGALKLPSSNSNYRGEIAVQRIAGFLGITIFPATVYKSLDKKTAKKLITVLQAKKFTTSRKDHHRRGIENKEKNRKEALRRLHTEANPGGCFKEWVENIQFVSALGTRENLGGHQVMKYLKADGPMPAEGAAVLKQCTSLMSEKGCFTGSIEWLRLARNISDMMLVDALSGNRDRFPGGNVHMRSLDGIRKRGPAGIHFPRVELLALDNGATFLGQQSGSLDDLTGRKVASTRVERFVKGRYEKLLELQELVRTDPAEAREKLFLREFRDPAGRRIDMFGQLAGNLAAVLDYMERNREKFGSRTILP